MPMTNELIQGLLKLLFQNVAYANVGDTSGLQGSGSAGVFYISLHSSDPGVSGTQSTSEVSYTGYGRVAVNRSASDWPLSSNTIDPGAVIQFGQCTAGSATAAYAGIGTAGSGAGHLLWTGPITPNISISVGVIPELGTASTATFT